MKSKSPRLDRAFSQTQRWCKGVLGWGGVGPSPEIPDPLDAEMAAKLLGGMAQLRDIVATQTDLEDLVILAFDLGQRAGMVGRENRLRVGRDRLNQVKSFSEKGVQSRRRQREERHSKLRADVMRVRNQHPNLSRRAEATKLLGKYGNGGDPVKALNALTKRIRRLDKRN